MKIISVMFELECGFRSSLYIYTYIYKRFESSLGRACQACSRQASLYIQSRLLSGLESKLRKAWQPRKSYKQSQDRWERKRPYGIPSSPHHPTFPTHLRQTRSMEDTIHTINTRLLFTDLVHLESKTDTTETFTKSSLKWNAHPINSFLFFFIEIQIFKC